MADARRLAELGMVPALAKEVAAQINSGVSDKRRLVELTMVGPLAQELASQINSGIALPGRLAEVGMVPTLAAEVVAQIKGAGVVLDPRAKAIIDAAAVSAPSGIMAVAPVFIGPCLGVSSVSSLAEAPLAGGTGYAVNDTFQINGGTLASGGAAATGIVVAVSGGVVTSWQPLTGGEYGIAGGNRPVSGATTTALTGSGTGLTVNLKDSVSPVDTTKTVFNNGPKIHPLQATFWPSVRDVCGFMTGTGAQIGQYTSRTQGSAAFNGSQGGNDNGHGKSIQTNSRYVDIVLGASSGFTLYVTPIATGIRERARLADYVTSGSGHFFYKFDFGSTAERKLEFYFGRNQSLRGFDTVAGATLSLPAADTIKIATVQDSWGNATVSPASGGGFTQDVNTSWAKRAGERLAGPNPLMNAIGGTGVINTASNVYNTFGQRIGFNNLDVAFIGAMNLILFPASQNDGGSSDAATGAAYQAALSDLMTRQPNAIIVCTGPQPVSTTTDSRHAAIKAATIAAAAGDKRIRYIDTSPATGVPVAATIGSDGAHLSSANNNQAVADYADAMAARILADLATMAA